MVDDDVGAVLAHGGEPGVGAAGADDAHPMRAREFDDRDADAASGAVDEDGLGRPRRGAVEQGAIRGGIRHTERGALSVGRAAGQAIELRRRTHHELCVGAGAARRISNPDCRLIPSANPVTSPAHRLESPRHRTRLNGSGCLRAYVPERISFPRIDASGRLRTTSPRLTGSGRLRGASLGAPNYG